MSGDIREKLKAFKGDNIVWIFILTILLYFGLSILTNSLVYNLTERMDVSDAAVRFANENYTYTIGSVILFVLVCLAVKKDRFILRSTLPAGTGKDHKILVPEDTYEAPQNNTAKTFLLGIIIGFVSIFFCIACALVHGDIKLYYDFSAAQIPGMIYAFVMVLFQGSSEELWCRGFMYERLNIRYPLWVAILVNGSFFGLMHCFNEGATVFAVAALVISGIEFSFLKWYTGSIWTAMASHTMWNFTQNFLFGLPNSGLVSEASVLHLDAANGVSNLIYDYAFGVEGAIPSLLADLIIITVILLLAKKKGRLKELHMSYEKTKALEAAEIV